MSLSFVKILTFSKVDLAVFKIQSTKLNYFRDGLYATIAVSFLLIDLKKRLHSWRLYAFKPSLQSLDFELTKNATELQISIYCFKDITVLLDNYF